MKVGTVALIGRPNTGKSTLLNNLLGQKVTITSPKPQTTRSSLRAVYEDERGQIIFVDTPGIFAKTPDLLSKRVNPQAGLTLAQGVDLILHLVDHTRKRALEENKTIGMIRNVKNTPKILVINKIDLRKPTYRAHYKFLEEEVDEVIEISALKKTHLKSLLEVIFKYLPEGKPLPETKERITPALDIDSKTFIAELIREKAFIFLRKEIPYSLTTVVDEVKERKDGLLCIQARILTTNNKYRKMIIGKKARMVKEIGMATRKELETATNKKVFLDLRVEVDKHWMERF
ncbi:GTPase Era [Candidatus Microgenomates bacterium]|nr:GTPase Era [Candidatus Microgenomates bacterium]